MKQKKGFKMATFIIIAVLVGWLSVGVVQGKNEQARNDTSVDKIFQNIRNANPVFEWHESILTFENEGMILVCSLTVPDTNRKSPIVLTLNGFGGDRNDLVIPGTGEPYFKRFSRLMAEQGIASLRLDFRGSGDSEGEYQMTTFSTQISDARAAVGYICKNLRDQVDTRSLGIMGFSQGGIVGSVTAAKDNRVKSLVLWSPVASPPHCYQGLLTRAGILKGLALADGGYDIFGVYVDDQYVSWDLPLGKGFFEDIFNIDPVSEIRRYRNPLMVIVGKNDPIVFPQPAKGQLYLKYHEGPEKLVLVDTDHAFNYWAGPQKPDDTFFWSIAWFIKTLK